MTPPTFSIIIPTYNRAQRLSKCLQSLADQTYKNFEVIVADDGSIDDTSTVVASFSAELNLKYIYSENWGGPARPRNLAIEASIANWICFLDSDDWWYPSKLEVVYRYLNIADIIYHDCDIYNNDNFIKFKRNRSRQLHAPVFIDLMVHGPAIVNSSVTVKKDILNKVGKLAEDRLLISVEDFDLWLKISRVTDRFHYINKSLGAYRTNDNNISQASDFQIERYNTVYNKHIYLLDENNRKRSLLLQCYFIGRSKQKMMSYESAITYFIKSLKSNNYKIKLKSMLLIVISSYYHLYNKLIKSNKDNYHRKVF